MRALSVTAARWWTTAVVTAIVAAMLVFAGPAGAAGRATPGTPVPQGFVGVDASAPMFVAADHIDLAKQFDLMVASGVQSVRVAFNWAAAQPYPNAAAARAAGARGLVPGAAGVPTNFAATDQLVTLAAKRRLSLLATVLYAPGWDAGHNSAGLAPPARPGPYANFLTTLIGRYGPRGSFWASHPGLPRVPVRSWQIWNEPNLKPYWPQPWLHSYTTLLQAAHSAVKRADSGAKVVLASLTNYAWTALRELSAVRGAKGDFDVIAVNGYTSTPRNVIRYLDFMHAAAVATGQANKPLLATEFSWPSSKGQSPQNYDWTTTEAGQARNITQMLPLLAANRARLHLAGFDYFTWVGTEYRGAPAFNFAGLLKWRPGTSVSAKPALAAYRRAALAIEGCQRKGNVATACIRGGR